MQFTYEFKDGTSLRLVMLCDRDGDVLTVEVRRKDLTPLVMYENPACSVKGLRGVGVMEMLISACLRRLAVSTSADFDRGPMKISYKFSELEEDE